MGVLVTLTSWKPSAPLTRDMTARRMPRLDRLPASAAAAAERRLTADSATLELSAIVMVIDSALMLKSCRKGEGKGE
eukprot:179559-Chlamydomonas_euryale.AAC.1